MAPTAMASVHRSVPPCSRWGYRQTLLRSFPSLVGLSLSLTDAGILLVLPGSATKAGGDAPGVDLMASQMDFEFLTTKTFV